MSDLDILLLLFCYGIGGKDGLALMSGFFILLRGFVYFFV